MKKRILFLACILSATCLFSACNQGELPAESETDLTTETAEAVTLSPEEALTAERTAYLSTVTYRDFVLTGEETPYYMGRWFNKEIDGISHKVTVTDGAHLYFLVENAPSFDVNFTVITTGTEPYFSYSIDGGVPVRQHITQPTVTLPDSGRHTVRIIADGMDEREGKWDLEKGFALRSVIPAEGGTLIGIRPTEKIVFFYGDSITEGVCALDRGSNSDTNSATNAYSWQCAETLGVTPYLVGYGASGIIKEGSFNTMLNAIDYLSESRPVNDGIIPDVIVVNHGTNDSGITRREYQDAVKATLDHLRATYPDAPIVYMIPLNQSHVRAITDAVAEIDNAHVVETRKWKPTYTDGLHPDAAGAQAVGEKLAAALVGIFGEDFFA